MIDAVESLPTVTVYRGSLFNSCCATRMTSSAVPMTQADWMRHYGPVWPSVQAAKQKYDPKNVLTPGHGMFPA